MLSQAYILSIVSYLLLQESDRWQRRTDSEAYKRLISHSKEEWSPCAISDWCLFLYIAYGIAKYWHMCYCFHKIRPTFDFQTIQLFRFIFFIYVKLYCVAQISCHCVVSFLLHYLFCIKISDISGWINYFSWSELFSCPFFLIERWGAFFRTKCITWQL